LRVIEGHGGPWNTIEGHNRIKVDRYQKNYGKYFLLGKTIKAIEHQEGLWRAMEGHGGQGRPWNTMEGHETC
jgi:hypothetical protein